MELAGSRKGRLVICDEGRAQRRGERGELPHLLVVREPKPHAYLSLAMPRESAGREGHGRDGGGTFVKKRWQFLPIHIQKLYYSRK